MVRTALGILLGAAICLASPHGFAANPTAAEVAKARPHYKRGVELYQDGAFDAALVELEKAYAIAPSYKLLYNVGLVYVQLNDFAGALKAYRQYLDEGGKKLAKKRRLEVEKEVRKLELRVGTVKLDVSVDGADVLVDDEVVAKSPVSEPLIVNAGKRKIAASKPGYAPIARVLVIVGGDEKELKLELRSNKDPKRKPAGTPRAPKKPDKVEEPSTPVPWLWWGVTGALAAGTTVVGVLALSSQSDLDDKKSAPSKGDDLQSSADKTRTLAIVTDVLLAGTVIVGGYATYKTFISPDEPEKDSARARPLDVQLGLGSVTVSGSF